MQLGEIKPGAKLVWRHARMQDGFIVWKAVHVVRLHRCRVEVLVRTSRGTARRYLKPERLSKRKDTNP
jgi:hypothetical protein